MKFKKYIIERVIPHNMSWIREYIKKIENKVSGKIKYMEYDNNGIVFLSTYDVEDAINAMNFDSMVHYTLIHDKPRYSCIVNAMVDSALDYITIFIDEQSFTRILHSYIEDKNSDEWKDFLDTLSEVISHELVHMEQYNRRRTQPVTNKLSRKYKSLSYYHMRDELMAHAGSAVREWLMYGFTKEKIKMMLQNTKKYEHDLLKSTSYSDFRDALKDSPLTWKRFLKYIYQYLETV
jgi:hypothetical protein